MFNLFACNQDDHSKNWAFLQSDNGQWQPAPFYDATYSPHPFNEHATAFLGYGKQPPLKAIQKLANTGQIELTHCNRLIILWLGGNISCSILTVAFP